MATLAHVFATQEGFDAEAFEHAQQRLHAIRGFAVEIEAGRRLGPGAIQGMTILGNEHGDTPVLSLAAKLQAGVKLDRDDALPLWQLAAIYDEQLTAHAERLGMLADSAPTLVELQPPVDDGLQRRDVTCSVCGQVFGVVLDADPIACPNCSSTLPVARSDA